ncbi:MAG: hypothetical protein KGQ57_00195 [Burkholderiales bacterium]|nr:hypothetical protein [Burkholderiales bacterium]
MNDKFDMKLVIDPVTTPLLHARLRAAGSYRERAALLRSLAEAALRGAVQPAAPLNTASVMQPSVQSVPIETESRPMQAAVTPQVQREVTSALETTNEGAADSHDVSQIADELAGYF